MALSAPRVATSATHEARRSTPLDAADLEAVMALETGVYPFPWTRRNFLDSLAAGYLARLLRSDADGRLLGYWVAMLGAGEMHLLNITVAAPERRCGHGRFMIEELCGLASAAGAQELWLEVRQSNAVARSAYAAMGFQERGVRPGYYPAAGRQRESAVLMSRRLDALD